MLDILTTVLAAAASYDLTNRDIAKSEINLNSTKDDAFIDRVVTEASRAAAQHCNRVFQVEVVRDTVYLRRALAARVKGERLRLSRWPIANFASVAFTGATHGTVTVDGIADTTGLSTGLPLFGGGIAAGTTIAAVGAGSITLSQAATATAAGVAFTTGMAVLETSTPGLPVSLVQGADYTLDPDVGWLIRLDPATGLLARWSALEVQVTYAAGYNPIPVDVEGAVLRLVVARYQARGRDPLLRSRDNQGLGSESFWVGSPGTSGAMPEEIAGILNNYRVPVVG